MHTAARVYHALPSFRLGRVLLVLLAVLLLPGFLVSAVVGCATTSNPIAIAQTPEQRYDAVLLTYNALLEPATQLIEDAGAPLELRRALQNAVRASAVVYAGANQAYLEFRNAKAAIGAGPDTESKLVIATSNLEKWAGQMDGIVGQLKTLAHRN